MWGIGGIFEFANRAPLDHDLVNAMTETIVHRGPDDEGIYLGPGIGLDMHGETTIPWDHSSIAIIESNTG
jgi:asparagine synthase (glutamine-hydrolysing)